ncbi:helix-turn-helix domain-containing protein [Streptomyces litchfieldiae]|uniref:Helix-turn-helix transcriptional regulator n=1 Tax=Streptomyces litchfieldiae TaxID=3075543 RepID=A0ABU2ML82_9ACTN|nr:helix-turn-helix transcriptional regulator [Streptomyces sp. DSM 44938]MDT0342241.1 helix-turn-helix transcriptional regulator [Streptomyces sp. DSM 44938]
MNEFSGGEPIDGYAYFGLEVKEARLHAKLTQKGLADETHYQPPYISKVENGLLLGSAQFAAACDRVFNTSGFFARMRERINRREHPSWFEPYVKWEAQAESILDYSANLVTGILQTEDYAYAIYRHAHPTSSEQWVKRKVEARLRRREALDRPNPPLLWVILDESCLHRRIGGTQVMREQLGHLLGEAESPQITLQVLPFSTGAAPAAESFILLTFAEDPPLLYEESWSGGHVIDSSAQVAAASAAYDRLRADAMSPDDSRALIKKVMLEEYSR